jgi:hypothetical protein
MTLLITQFFPPYYYFILNKSKHSSKHPVLEEPQSIFFHICDTPSYTPTKTTHKTIVQYILIFIFLDSRPEEKEFYDLGYTAV